MSRIRAFLELAVKQGGSDLHLVSGQVPRVRIHGALHPVRFRELSPEDLGRVLSEFMPAGAFAQLEQRLAVDFAHEEEGIGRFRVNAYRHARGMAASLRVVPASIASFAELGLPSVLTTAAEERSGLILVTGPTGSGKSTTLAAIVDFVNATRKGHVITIEDPIEFIHTDKSSIVTQREIGTHAPSFAAALRDALREDPDVIMLGEMRDAETIGLALTAAETGIQILGTLHTNGSSRSVDRIISAFPGPRQEQARAMLAQTLRLIVSQQLVRRADGEGRMLAAEVLVNNQAASALIRSGKAHQLHSVIQAGGKLGMRSLDAELRRLLRKGEITREEAYNHAVDRSKFESVSFLQEMS
jgi:twitching motility protein PilT